MQVLGQLRSAPLLCVQPEFVPPALATQWLKPWCAREVFSMEERPAYRSEWPALQGTQLSHLRSFVFAETSWASPCRELLERLPVFDGGRCASDVSLAPSGTECPPAAWPSTFVRYPAEAEQVFMRALAMRVHSPGEFCLAALAQWAARGSVLDAKSACEWLLAQFSTHGFQRQIQTAFSETSWLPSMAGTLQQPRHLLLFNESWPDDLKQLLTSKVPEYLLDSSLWDTTDFSAKLFDTLGVHRNVWLELLQRLGDREPGSVAQQAKLLEYLESQPLYLLSPQALKEALGRIALPTADGEISTAAQMCALADREVLEPTRRPCAVNCSHVARLIGWTELPTNPDVLMQQLTWAGAHPEYNVRPLLAQLSKLRVVPQGLASQPWYPAPDGHLVCSSHVVFVQKSVPPSVVMAPHHYVFTPECGVSEVFARNLGVKNLTVDMVVSFLSRAAEGSNAVDVTGTVVPLLKWLQGQQRQPGDRLDILKFFFFFSFCSFPPPYSYFYLFLSVSLKTKHSGAAADGRRTSAEPSQSGV